LDFNNQRQKSNRVNWAIAGTLLIIIVSLVLYFITFYGSLSLLHENWGSFGDYVGGIAGTLFAGLAVYLIYLTYRLQQVELNKTTEALSTQNEQLKIQQFQNIVFKLLERKDHQISGLRHKQAEGIHALSYINSDFRGWLKKSNKREDALKQFWKSHRRKLTPYFNTFISTVEFFQSFKSNDKEQDEIRAQLIKLYSSNLSTSEKTILNLIFEYHQAHEPDYEEINKWRSYVKDNGILE